MIEDNESFFSSLSTDDGDLIAKHLLILTWLTIQSVSLPSMIGIILYEHHHPSQTILNKLKVYIFSVGAIHVCTSVHLLAYRAIGDANATLCAANDVATQISSFATVLTICESTLLRYLYTCVWKNVGALDDDLVAKYLLIVNSVVATLYAIVLALTGQYMTFRYAACTGLEPTLEFTTNLMEGRIRFNDACLWFGLLLSIAVSLAIHWHLKESDPALEYFVSELFTTTKMYECVTLAIMVTSIIPLQMINSKISQGQDISTMSPLFVTFALVSVYWATFVIFPISLYWRNPQLRVYVAKAIKKRFMSSALYGLYLAMKPKNAVAPQLN